ncbi:MAG: glycosyl hydrolase, partial [Flavitalea sp.]
MNVFQRCCCCLLFLLMTDIAFTQPEWKIKYRDPATVAKMFSDPPMFYAPHVFWFWDDTLRNDHYPSEMANEMAKQRLNPGYAHPRSSMGDGRFPSLPPAQYLEKPWFNNFSEAVNAAKKAGTFLGYCDDYNWPSGQAAGRVLREHPELEAKHLVWKRITLTKGAGINDTAADFAVIGKLINGSLDAGSLKVLEKKILTTWRAPNRDWIAYTYSKQFHAGIDGGKVNYLDPQLMKVFIPMVHEQYAKYLPDEMGKTIPGVFVDNEGDYGWHMAWSEHFAEVYKQKKKRDLRLWLPMLTEQDTKGLYAKARFDWFDVLTDVYNECFFEPLVSWLADKNMYYISNLWEESLQLQAGAVGDFMRITRSVTMPGTDCLLMKSQDVHDFKETQTVAEFEDRPFMSEIMGVAGWEQTPAMMKRSVNSIISYGVSHIVPHGIYMNRKLETQPFPADWYTENPYWPYIHQWADFCRRASFVTRQSDLVADVLLVNPQESIWANSEKLFDHTTPESPEPWNAIAGRVEELYSGAMRRMNENNLDFLIGDTYYLNKSKVEEKDGEMKLKIGNHSFKVIVLPPISLISRTVSDKILSFAAKGGSVIILGNLPKGSTEVGAIDPVVIA